MAAKLNEAVVAKRLEVIRKLAGTMPARDIAARLSMSASNLGHITRKHGISLAFSRPPRAPAPKRPAKPKDDKVTDEAKLESASQLLRSHGWTVIRPDPFLDRKRQLQEGAR